MKVSIIIPVYNVAPYIEQCLLSVYTQSYKKLEIIIVDDRGSDNSMELARRVSAPYMELFEIIFLEHERNRGISAARNTGILAATGEYIYFLDSDDSITESCIEVVVNSMEGVKYDFVASDHVVISNKKRGPKLGLESGVVSDSRAIEMAYYNSQLSMHAWNKLLNREFIISHDIFFKEGIIHEDDLWGFMLANAASLIRVIKEVTYLHYERENSIMTSLKFENSMRCRYIIIDTMNDYVSTHKDSVDVSVYSYIEQRKLKMFKRAKLRKVGLRRVLDLYKYIRETPLVDESKITKRERLYLFNRRLPVWLGFVYLRVVYRFNRTCEKFHLISKEGVYVK
ncbi:MAG: glycosyltransferase family 2 protein [Rikenellaceae bacterium]